MLNIKTQLLIEIELYCKANNISDPDKFCNNMLEKAFIQEKYGKIPNIIATSKNDVEVIPEAKSITKQIEESTIIIKKNIIDDDYEIYDNP